MLKKWIVNNVNNLNTYVRGLMGSDLTCYPLSQTPNNKQNKLMNKMKLSKIIDYYIGSWALDYIKEHSSDYVKEILKKEFKQHENRKNKK